MSDLPHVYSTIKSLEVDAKGGARVELVDGTRFRVSPAYVRSVAPMKPGDAVLVDLRHWNASAASKGVYIFVFRPGDKSKGGLHPVPANMALGPSCDFESPALARA